LTTVPWHVIDDGPRREVESAPPEMESDPDGGVETRLKALGYAE